MSPVSQVFHTINPTKEQVRFKNKSQVFVTKVETHWAKKNNRGGAGG